jgi:hypothetical protein
MNRPVRLLCCRAFRLTLWPLSVGAGSIIRASLHMSFQQEGRIMALPPSNPRANRRLGT